MKIATINISDKEFDAINTLVNLNLYPNRSEAIRQAMKQFLEKEIALQAMLDNFEQLKKQGVGSWLG